jgi:hypothetical protein
MLYLGHFIIFSVRLVYLYYSDSDLGVKHITQINTELTNVIAVAN